MDYNDKINYYIYVSKYMESKGFRNEIEIDIDIDDVF